MAGAKGKSGGAREGAGRKPNPQNPNSHKTAPVRISSVDEETFVYVIYESDDPSVSKVGVATDVVKRLGTMQIGSWRILRVGHAVALPSKSAAHAIERQVHQALSALHVRGEWFRTSPDRAAFEVDLAVSQLRAAFNAAAKLGEPHNAS
ncbi:GIY-YIG nuclease family protein [Massilia genomosp. 1]|uniref:Bacteriophage T5 Orf172 DNA-binding domain-containing protein n=1 Tax=Massilia genomosp. 1 TaxID=2609280 RepID=A0ABX0MQ56_9BURK|nr:GIY-YIG nuclease family protein [Massilia genomosp. 1]NHZ62623.1 hypothetical protein [Massilia genomosp. 1]